MEPRGLVSSAATMFGGITDLKMLFYAGNYLEEVSRAFRTTIKEKCPTAYVYMPTRSVHIGTGEGDEVRDV